MFFCVLFVTIIYQSGTVSTNVYPWEIEFVKEDEVIFFLYTRENPSQPIQLFPNNLNQVNTNRSVKFIIHGFFENSGRLWYKNMTNEYLRKGDYNVVQVDWSRPASVSYTAASINTREVGSIIGRLIAKLHKSHGLPLENIHIIGHSLGAHVAGYAGKEVLRCTGSRLARITALDAAGPLFEGPLLSLEGLTKSDAVIVDAIHTDSGMFGREKATGTADFFPNSGTGIQPGCASPDRSFPPRNYVELQSEVFCSHTKSYYYFISSINEEKFLALKCSTWNEFKGKCCTRNETAFMGDDYIDSSDTTGFFYYLSTNTQPPFARRLL